MGHSGMSGSDRGTLQDGSEYSRVIPGRVGGPLGRSGTGRGTLEQVRARSRDLGEVRGTIGKVRDGSEDLRGGPGRVGGPLGRFGPGRGTFREVQNRSRDPRVGLRRVKGP